MFDEGVENPVRIAARTPIGPIFRRFASLLQLYEQYVENRAFARADIQEFLDKPAFQQYWKKCADDVRSTRFDQQQQQISQENHASRLRKLHSDNLTYSPTIVNNSPVSMQPNNAFPFVVPMSNLPQATTSLSGYLILPIQRVPRYVLLLEQIQSLTEKILQLDIGILPSSTLLHEPRCVELFQIH